MAPTSAESEHIMRLNNIPVRYVGQHFGANYADPYPGDHVKEFVSLDDAKETLTTDSFRTPGDTLLLWKADVNDSPAEAHSRTLSDAAEADYLLTLGPRDGVKVEKI